MILIEKIAANQDNVYYKKKIAIACLAILIHNEDNRNKNYGSCYSHLMGHGYTGHEYTGHGYTGHGYTGHGYMGHGYTGHGYMGHGYTGHKFSKFCLSTGSRIKIFC